MAGIAGAVGNDNEKQKNMLNRQFNKLNKEF